MTPFRVISQEIAGSALASAAQRGLASEWYPERPHGADGWRSYLEGVAAAHRSGAWLPLLASAFGARGNAASRLDRVAKAGGVVVSTGQQAALFGGPLYTLIKALSALAVADALEQETGVPAAPVFWAATDDADYEEACWAAFALTGGLRTVRLPPADRAGVPMNRVPLRGVEPLFDALVTASGSAVDSRPIEIVRETFTSGATLGNAYLRLLRDVLEPLSIPVLDASHAAVREGAVPMLRRALERAGDLERALRARHDAIRAGGYVPQVEHLPDLTLVFAEQPDGEKRRIPVREASQHTGSTAASLGPNVLLRPVIERFLMPSACYVAGPGEFAYFAQVSAVADTLQSARPLPVPRWSATILEPRIERLLDRLGLTREELRDKQGVETRLARAALPTSVHATLRALRKDLASGVAALEESDRDKLVPAASLEGVRHSIEHRLDRLERRYAAGVKRRQVEMMRDVSTAAAALYPNGKPQERVLNFIPFLARYGAPLLDAMRSEAATYARSLLGASKRPAVTEQV